MKISKAVITAAAPKQRTLALQTVIDRDGDEKTVLRIILEEVRRAQVEQIAVVIAPGDEAAYARAASDRTIRFIEQSAPEVMQMRCFQRTTSWAAIRSCI